MTPPKAHPYRGTGSLGGYDMAGKTWCRCGKAVHQEGEEWIHTSYGGSYCLRPRQSLRRVYPRPVTLKDIERWNADDSFVPPSQPVLDEHGKPIKVRLPEPPQQEDKT
jgi:hypothetical protein